MRLRWRMLGIKSNNTNIHVENWCFLRNELKYIENRGIYIDKLDLHSNRNTGLEVKSVCHQLKGSRFKSIRHFF